MIWTTIMSVFISRITRESRTIENSNSDINTIATDRERKNKNSPESTPDYEDCMKEIFN